MKPAHVKHLRALHAAAARRFRQIPADERHELIRTACGVPTLNLDPAAGPVHLTEELALKVLSDWNSDRPPQRRTYKRRIPGTLKLSTDSQRNGIQLRLDALGWPDIDRNHRRVPEHVRRIRDWRDPSLSTSDLSAIITWLQLILDDTRYAAKRQGAAPVLQGSSLAPVLQGSSFAPVLQGSRLASSSLRDSVSPSLPTESP